MNNDILDLAKQLISIPSEKNNSEALQKSLEVTKNILQGFTTHEFESNGVKSLLFSNADTNTKHFKIILNAHLDVVPGEKDQYTPDVDGNKLIGRGSYDMKSAAAALILTFKEIANKVTYPIALQIVTDEEVGGFNGTKYQIKQGIRGDFVIAGENTDLLINNESKGIIWLTLTTQGKSAHGAYPWLGDNAIWKMKKNLDILEKQYPVPTKESWETTINLATISTNNETFNKVPDECKAGFDIRYIPQEEHTVVDKITSSIVKGTQHAVAVKEPAHFTDPENPYIQSLLKSIKEITNKDGVLIKKHGGSDIRFYNSIGCKGITFGPIGEGHHSDYEWVDIISLINYAKILQHFLLCI